MSGVTEPLRRVVLATSNRGKLADFRRLFEGTGIELDLPGDHGLALDVEETGETFIANALLKARVHARALGLPVLADDSGLTVEALHGRPGVYSARYAGPECDDHANNLKVIAEVAEHTNRAAAFECALALVLPSALGAGEGAAHPGDDSEAIREGEVVVTGRCEGRIVDEERGENGFGYDVIFFRDDLSATFGEATPEQKNARSHRGVAVRDLIAELERCGRLSATR